MQETCGREALSYARVGKLRFHDGSHVELEWDVEHNGIVFSEAVRVHEADIAPCRRWDPTNQTACDLATGLAVSLSWLDGVDDDRIRASGQSVRRR